MHGRCAFAWPARGRAAGGLLYSALLSLALYLGAAPLVAAQEKVDLAASPLDFASVLELAEINAADFAVFSQWDSRLTPARTKLAEQLLFRLRRFDTSGFSGTASLGQVDAANAGKLAGKLFVATGMVESVQRLDAVGDGPIANVGFISTMVVEGQPAPCTILSAEVPRAWITGDVVKAPFSDVRFVGVLLAAEDSRRTPRLVLLTERFQWRPADYPLAGVAWLAGQGFDAALLDEVQHERGFVLPSESREAEAFNECLAIMRRTDVATLVARVRQSLSSTLPELESNAAKIAANWRKLRQLKAGVSTEQLESARQKALLQSEVAKYAARGLTSVAPMFLTAHESTGQFALIDGIARRAVRVLSEDAEASEDVARPQLRSMEPTVESVDHYYELEVFTPDSQNLPIVCCVAELPDGFPEGDVIRQPVRIAGIFLKKWVYQTRRTSSAGHRGGEIGAAPIIIAPTVIMLRDDGDGKDSEVFAIGGGIALLSCLVLLWLVFWRTDRLDRKARKLRGPHVSEIRPPS